MHRALLGGTVHPPYDRLTTLCLTLITPSPPYASSSTSRLLSLLCLSQTRNSTTSPLLSPNVVVVTFHSLYEHFLFRPYPQPPPFAGQTVRLKSTPNPTHQHRYTSYARRHPSDVTSPITPRHPTRHTRTRRTPTLRYLHTHTRFNQPTNQPSPPAASAVHRSTRNTTCTP